MRRTGQSSGGRTVSVTSSGTKPIPRIPMLEAARVALSFRNDPLHTLVEVAQRYGDAAACTLPLGEFVLLRAPEMVDHVLSVSAQNYTHDTWDHEQIRLIMGHGLLTSQGEVWARQRRIVEPAFRHERLPSLLKTMADSVARLGDRWDRARRVGSEMDIAAAMSQLTLEIATRTLLTTDLGADAQGVVEAITTLGEYLGHCIRSRTPLPLSWPTPRNRRVRAALATLDRIIYGIIRERRRTGVDRGDFLSLLLAHRDERSGESLPDEVVRDEVFTFVATGQQTAAMNLVWTLYLLAQNPAVEEAVRAEVGTVLGGRVPELEDLGRLDLLARVIKESMRMYPPSWITARRSIADDVVAGFALPRQSLVLIVPWVTHRNARYWPDPERFDPARFESANEASRPAGVYIPFGGGPRKCIGERFAMVEVQVVLAILLQRYRFVLRPGYRAEPDPALVVQVKDGLPMRLCAE